MIPFPSFHHIFDMISLEMETQPCVFSNKFQISPMVQKSREPVLLSVGNKTKVTATLKVEVASHILTTFPSNPAIGSAT